MINQKTVTSNWECPTFAAFRIQEREAGRTDPAESFTYLLAEKGHPDFVEQGNPEELPVFCGCYEGKAVAKVWWLR